MNHGLTLFKPGESKLGFAMRLLLVNQHSWKRASLVFEERVRHLDWSNLSFDLENGKETPKTLSALQGIHAQFLKYKPELQVINLPLNISYKASQPVRQCSVCAKVGHHSVLFELPWVKKCPVHDEVLSSLCPVCKCEWPSISKLATCSCEYCGLRISLNKLIVYGAFDASLFNQKVPDMVRFFQTKVELLQPRRKFFLNQQAIREDFNSLGNAFPSLLGHINLEDSNSKNRLKSLGVNFDECKEKSFKLVPMEDGNDAKLNLKLMEKCRQRVFLIAKKVITKKLKNNQCSCKTNKEFQGSVCSYCETLRQLELGFNCSVSSREDRLLLSYAPPLTQNIEIPDPGIVVKVYDLENHCFFEVPEEVQALIYSVELWQAIVRMFSHILYYLEAPVGAENLRQKSHLELSNYLRHTNHHFTPFFFLRNKQSCSVIFPKAFVRRNLKYSKILIEKFTECNI